MTAVEWSQDTIVAQRPAVVFCVLATITHAVFWIQVYHFSSYRKTNMQWIYAYLITDQLLIVRFFSSYIIHTGFYQSASNSIWTFIICLTDATVDNYLNFLAIYILLAINICRYCQIVQNHNVYRTNPRLIVLSHFVIYLTPIIILAVQLTQGWVELITLPGDNCSIQILTLGTQMFNVIHAYALPIFLNVLVILLSLYHVHLKTFRRQDQIRISARDKYHRSMVIQFLLFYVIWLAFWSPDVLVYQFTTGDSVLNTVTSLLNYVGIMLDPIVIAALDIRVRKGWVSSWHLIKKRFVDVPARVAPTTTVQREGTRF